MIVMMVFIMSILFLIKGYYMYKYLVIEETQSFMESFMGYISKPKHKNHKMYSMSFGPIISETNYEESRKAKATSNTLLVIVYIMIGLIILLSLMQTR